MNGIVRLDPIEAQDIYETVAANRAKTRGSMFDLIVENGKVISIKAYPPVIIGPNEIKKKV